MAIKRKSIGSASANANPAKRPAPALARDDDEDFISDDGEDLLTRAAGQDDEDDSGDSEDDDEVEYDGEDDVEDADLGDEALLEGAIEGDEQEDVEMADESADDEDDDDAEGLAPKTYDTKKGSSLYKAPTHEEMETLKAGTSLFKSSLFSMQLDLLLPSIRPLARDAHPTPPALTALVSTLQSLRTTLLALPELPPTTPRLTRSQYPNLPYPSTGPADDAKWLMSFLPPSEAQIVGDWVLGTRSSAKGKGKKEGKEGTVDLALTIPEGCFQDKDFMNGRYFFKRVYWLGVIGKALEGQLGALGLGSIEWAEEVGSEWKPVLVLRSKQDKSSTDFSKLNLTITIRPVISSSLFSASKLAPTKNSLRPPPSDLPPPPTPLYNAALLAETVPSTHLLYLHKLSLALPAFKDASLLLQLWASQRGFGSTIPWVGPGGFSTFVEMVLGYLVFGGGGLGKVEGGKRLGRGMSSYQIFRGVLDFFVAHNWLQTPIFMKNAVATGAEPKGKIAPEEFTKVFKAVFVEPTGAVNLLAGVEEGVVQMLGHEARIALSLLDGEEGEGEGEDIFEGTFLRDLKGGQLKYDLIFRIDISEAKALLQPTLARLDQPSRVNHLITSISSVVRQALSTRARIVVVQRPYSSSSSSASTTWPFASPRPVASDLSNILELGIVLDPAEATRLVDHGPAAEDAEGSKAFQAFWGEKSELRRFKDGRILESVVWEVGSAQDERALIVGRSVRYILKRHFNLNESSINVESSAGYLELLRMPTSAVDLISTEEGAGLEGFRPAMQAYQELYRVLKGMDDLPLSLLNVFPVAEGLRYASVFPPLAVDLDRFSLTPDCLKYVEPLDVVVQFESSGRWPDELAAIQKIKLAFFEKMARSFQKQVEGSIVSVVVDDIIDAEGGLISDNCHLEIFVPSGYAFRLRIHHDREKTLLERLIADKKDAKPPLRRLAQKALDLHLCRFTHLPRHHAALNSLHHLYPSFTPTVRLVKRWFASHLLSSHVPAEMIELICANVFLSPTTTSIPSSPSAGFARVISLLARWKWHSSPLLVPLYSASGLEAGKKVSLPKDRRDAAMEAFKRMRATDPNVSAGALFVATEEDTSGKVFGASNPSKVVANRMVHIARATLKYLEEAGRDGTLSVKQLFLHPLSDYSFLIHLKPALLPRASQAIEPDQHLWTSKYKNVASLQASNTVYGKELRVAFDPASLYLKDLQRLFNDSFLLFHDPLGGAVIGGIFNPQLQAPRNFKVQLGFNSRPVALEGSPSSQQVRLNESGILAEVARLGEGLIERIEVR